MPDPLPSVDEFLRLAHRFAIVSWPGCHPKEIHIVMDNGQVMPLALLGIHATNVNQFYPQQYQTSVMQSPAPNKGAAQELQTPRQSSADDVGAPAQETWQPNDNQQAILAALEFRALKTDDLIRESGVCRGRLYQRPFGGIHELRQRGMIRLHRKYGYYCPDAPPEELMNGEENEMPERKK